MSITSDIFIAYRERIVSVDNVSLEIPEESFPEVDVMWVRGRWHSSGSGYVETYESFLDASYETHIEPFEQAFLTQYALQQEPTWDDIRIQRNTLLAESDWTDLPNNALDAAAACEWQIYRQDLRDIPQIYQYTTTVVWPTKPS